MITYASGQGMSMCPVSECVCRMSQHWHGTPSIFGQGMSMCLVSECVCRMSQYWHGTPLFSLHRRHMITSSNHMSTMVKSHGTPSIFGQTFHIWSNFPYLVKLSIFGQAFTVPEDNYPNVHIVDTHWLTLLLENLPHTFSQVQRILQQCC